MKKENDNKDKKKSIFKFDDDMLKISVGAISVLIVLTAYYHRHRFLKG